MTRTLRHGELLNARWTGCRRRMQIRARETASHVLWCGTCDRKWRAHAVRSNACRCLLSRRHPIVPRLSKRVKELTPQILARCVLYRRRHPRENTSASRAASEARGSGDAHLAPPVIFRSIRMVLRTCNWRFFSLFFDSRSACILTNMSATAIASSVLNHIRA
jgi:hypothetical protein